MLRTQRTVEASKARYYTAPVQPLPYFPVGEAQTLPDWINQLHMPRRGHPYLSTANGLVHHHACIGQRLPLTRFAGRQEQGGHGAGLAHADGGDWALDVLFASGGSHIYQRAWPNLTAGCFRPRAAV